MSRWVFDIETDGFIPVMKNVWCLVMKDLDTGEMFIYDDSGAYEPIKTGLHILQDADQIWGHNIALFDIPAIQKLYPWFEPEGEVMDTLILSRMFMNDMLDRDFRTKPPTMPINMYGRHSLESWGHRLGVHKSEFGKSLEGDWSQYTPEMRDYCAQDVEVNYELCQIFDPKVDDYKQSITTEMELAKIMAWQEQSGFPFDVQKAQALESELRVELEGLANQLRDTFRDVDGGTFTPRRDNKTKGYVTGATFSRIKAFNPTSRQHIAWAFAHYRQWEPEELTDTGRPKIDSKVLTEIGTEEALQFARILDLQKALGQLSEGQNAWLKLVRNGRIHHTCMLTCATGRQSHLRPNIAQVKKGSEYRELFGPGEGRVQVAADAQGLELRCLGHYLYPLDSGAFAEEVVKGDIHTKLAEIYGNGISRSVGKGVTYSLIYGASNPKIGITAGASKVDAAKEGKRIRAAVMKNLTGFKELSDRLAERAKTGVIRAIDGRPIRVAGKEYCALNYLMQSAGSCLCKTWVIQTNKLLQEAGIEYEPLAFVHDEQQLSVKPEHAEQAAFILTAAMKDVEQTYKFRCQLDAEAKVGANWAECH